MATRVLPHLRQCLHADDPNVSTKKPILIQRPTLANFIPTDGATEREESAKVSQVCQVSARLSATTLTSIYSFGPSDHR
jgi:uncharacterized tellurite resistance protein B-like protein